MKKVHKFKSLGSPQNAAGYTYSPSFTFDGNLPAEVFMRPSIGTPALSDIFNIRQGIRTDEYLVLGTPLSKILKAAAGCSPSYTASGTLSDRKISVSKFEVNHEWCKSDWEAAASQLTNDPSWMADGLDGFEPTAKLRSLLFDSLLDSIRRDIARISFFANDASGNADYNMIEGLLVKMYDANSSYCVKRVGNSLGNAATTVLTTDEALTALTATHEGAAIILKQIPNSEKVFWVTGAVYENYLKSLESKNGGTEGQFRLLQDGTTQLFFRGIEVRPLWFADNDLQDSANPWYNNIKNFVIYTTKGTSQYANLVLGVENAADLNRIEGGYDFKEKTYYMQAAMRFGVQFIHCDLIAFHD
jgi:hypothetical protein